jgi:hypothetical protein
MREVKTNINEVEREPESPSDGKLVFIFTKILTKIAEVPL